jgi:membrane-bound ClpP family serine protease
MRQFKDSEGRTWNITVNVGTAKTVKALTGVNLFDLYKDEVQRVFSDPELLVNVIYSLCKAQADKREITDIQFGEAMVGDALELAADALMESVADFFPSSRSQILRKMKSKSEEIAKKMTTAALNRLDSLTVEEVTAAMKAGTSKQPTSSPVQSE